MVDNVKRVNLNLSGISARLKQEAKNKIGRFIIDSTLEEISKGQSPVDGEGRWRLLNPDYAEAEKGGDRTPNMELKGDMLDKYKFTTSGPLRNYIDVGIRGTQGEKSESHNHLGGSGKNPRRRFIPGENQEYIDPIESEIRKIENEFRDKERQRQARRRNRDNRETASREQSLLDQVRDLPQNETAFTVPLRDVLRSSNLAEVLFEEFQGAR